MKALQRILIVAVMIPVATLASYSAASAHGSTVGEGLRLAGANPIRGTSALAFRINHPMNDIDLTVFDITGRRALQIFHGALSAGDHRFAFSGSGLAAGTYRVRLITEHGIYNKSVTVVH